MLLSTRLIVVVVAGAAVVVAAVGAVVVGVDAYGVVVVVVGGVVLEVVSVLVLSKCAFMVCFESFRIRRPTRNFVRDVEFADGRRRRCLCRCCCASLGARRAARGARRD